MLFHVKLFPQKFELLLISDTCLCLMPYNIVMRKENVIMCVQQYLETAEMDIPAAEMEPLLACVPCPVLDMPESLLGPPYQAIVTKRNQVKHSVSLGKNI